MSFMRIFQYRKWGIRMQILTPFSTVFILMLILLSLYIQMAHHALAEESVHQRADEMAVVFQELVEQVALETNSFQGNEHVTEFVGERTLGKNGYFYIVDTTGTLLYHKKPDMVGKSIADKDFFKEMLSKKNGTVTYLFNGLTKVVGFRTLSNGTLAAAGYEVDEAFLPYVSLERKIILMIAGSGVLMLLAMLIIIAPVRRAINSSIKGFIEVAKGDMRADSGFRTRTPCKDAMQCDAKHCAEYHETNTPCHLTVGSEAATFGREPNCVKIVSGVLSDCKECGYYQANESNNEVAQMVMYTEAMIRKLSLSLSSVNVIANEIGSESSELSAATEQVSSNIMQQNGAIESIATAMAQIARGVEAVAGKISASEELARNSYMLSEGNEEKSQQIRMEMEQFAKSIKELIDAIMVLKRNSTSMNEILNLIGDIADQTNLLSLNAAIEAARAGEAGRGFAVVADEVRKLAERTVKAVDDIGKMVRENNVCVDSTVQEVESRAKQVTVIAAGVEELTETARNTKANSGKTSEHIGEIAIAIQQQASAVSEVECSLGEVVKGINEINGATQILAEMSGTLRKGSMTLGTEMEKYTLRSLA